MANNLTGRQWFLDTAIPFGSAASLLWRGNVKVKDAMFSGYSAQGAKCIIKDGRGRIVAEATGSSTMEPVKLGELGWVADGFCLDTLDSGRLVVYIK